MAFLTRSNKMACPIQIATIDTPDETSVAKLDVSEIRGVIENNKIEDIPVVVVAIAGIARRGKSFLLNLLIAYLKHMAKSPDTDFKASTTGISGMNWDGGRAAVTKGIWLWGEPFVIDRKDESKIAILLVDTQGICDGVSSARGSVDSQIIFMTLSMATIYIHNLDKEWKMPEKKVYEICKSFAEVYGGVNQIFNSITLLYRNWVEDEPVGLRTDLFTNEIDLAKEDSVASKIMNGIDKLFRHKTVWVFPEPSLSVRKCGGNENIQLADVGDEFLCTFVKFANDLFGLDGNYSQQMNGTVTGRKFIEIMEDLSERLIDWPELTTDADQLKDFYVRKAYYLAKDQFQDKYKSEIENSVDVDEIQNWFTSAEYKAIECYQIQARNVPSYDKFYNRYLKKLKIAIERKIELCRHNAERKILIKQCEQLNDEIKRVEKKLQDVIKDNKRQEEENERERERISAIVKTLETEVANRNEQNELNKQEIGTYKAWLQEASQEYEKLKTEMENEKKCTRGRLKQYESEIKKAKEHIQNLENGHSLAKETLAEHSSTIQQNLLVIKDLEMKLANEQVQGKEKLDQRELQLQKISETLDAIKIEKEKRKCCIL